MAGILPDPPPPRVSEGMLLNRGITNNPVSQHQYQRSQIVSRYVDYGTVFNLTMLFAARLQAKLFTGLIGLSYKQFSCQLLLVVKLLLTQ